MDTLDQNPQDMDPVLLEAVELELALQSVMPFKDGRESAVQAALAKSGGTLLFDMNTDPEGDDAWVGAVLLGTDAEAKVALVTISEKAGSVSVETAERSHSPLARIAPAFVDVMAYFQTAA